MSDIKNIVVIGASVAGGNLVNELVPHLPRNYRILLIDALAFSSWPIASLRAAVVPGWEKRISVPLTKENIFPAGSIHEVIAPNKVVELRESSVILEKPFEGSTEIHFYKAVIATGASQPSPMRPAPGSSEQEYIASLTKLQRDFARAQKVLIIGAGSVGIELAGELRENHPDQEITLVHNRSHVLNPSDKTVSSESKPFSYSNPPTALKLSKALESLLSDSNINLILGDRVSIPSPGSVVDSSEWDGSSGYQNGVKKVKLESGKIVEADFVFTGTGNKPNVSLVKAADPQALASGLVAVDDYLKVVSQNPRSILTTNYYAIGDAASSPGWKNSQGAQQEGAAAAANILAEIRSKPIKPHARAKPYAMVVPLGANSGSGSLELPLLGVVLTPQFMVKAAKGKKLFVEDLFYSRFKGSKKPVVPALP